LGITCLNISLLGRIGHGKSSFCNTLFSALEGKITTKAITRDDIETVTLKVGKFPVNTKHTIKIWDVFGW
jgi:predicted GTPase